MPIRVAIFFILVFSLIFWGSGRLEVEAAEKIGVVKSVDKGATWTFLGHGNFNAPSLIPVDPDPLLLDNQVILYFFDIAVTRTGGAANHDIYRAVTEDGLNFSTPIKVYSTSSTVTDPSMVLLPNGIYRLFLSFGNQVVSASGSTSQSFVADAGSRSTVGGVPGALVLPDNRIRLFVCGAGGIISLISSDGLSFTKEAGVRLASSTTICDPHPLRLLNGNYLMTYKITPAGGHSPTDDQVWLATSTDALNWTPGSSSIVKGSVPGIVELSDGTLLIYYVSFESDFASYVITATAGAGGTISPAGSVSVTAGANQTFVITPKPGHAIAKVVVNGTRVGAVSTYTFTNVTAAHSIQAVFSQPEISWLMLLLDK